MNASKVFIDDALYLGIRKSIHWGTKTQMGVADDVNIKNLYQQTDVGYYTHFSNVISFAAAIYTSLRDNI